MKPSGLIPLAAAMFGFGYLHALAGLKHPGWFVLALVVCLFAVAMSFDGD